jgi:hypothetical protein
MQQWHEINGKLSQAFAMEDLGELHFILGIEVKRDRPRRTIKLGQRSYIDTILARFGMLDAKTVKTALDVNVHLQSKEDETSVDIQEYQSIVGSLMYLMVGTRPDISFAVSKLSQFLSRPTASHRTAALRVLRYVKGTREMELCYHGEEELHGFCDADYAMDVDTRRSTTGYLFKLNGGAISWQSKRQASTALSTAEAEYMALCAATKEAIWLRNVTHSILNTKVPYPALPLYEDNQAAIRLADNPVDHQRTKHIDVRYHFTREAIIEGQITVQYHPTERMIADMLTKSLPYPRLQQLCAGCGLLARHEV